MRITLAVVMSFTWIGSALAQATSASDPEEVKATLIAMWDAIEQRDVERNAGYIHPEFTSLGEGTDGSSSVTETAGAKGAEEAGATRARDAIRGYES